MIKRLLHRFWTDTRAAVAFETVIMTPILAWSVMASFVFFDAYRVYNTSVKATYSVADIISRQTSTLYGYDINGMADMFSHMVRDTTGARMRVTQIYWTGSRYRVDWSHATGGEARLFDASMEEIEELLPVLSVSERVLLVETFVPYRPAFQMGLNVVSFSNFTFTRPRYANQVPFDDDETPPTS